MQITPLVMAGLPGIKEARINSTTTPTSKTVGTYTVTVTIDDFTADCIVNVVEDMTGVDNTTTVTLEPRKQIVNGQVLIRTQDGTYTLMGQEL